MKHAGMAEWKPSREWAWEYNLPPYRGVLIPVHVDSDGCLKRYAAHIEAQHGNRCAPHLFDDIRTAQAWIEREVGRLSAIQ